MDKIPIKIVTKLLKKTFFTKNDVLIDKNEFVNIIATRTKKHYLNERFLR